MDLLQGTLDMLVLRTLLAGSLHGYGIAKNIRSASNEALDTRRIGIAHRYGG
jgi:DNA-binding PadR family transcriptional regulator